MRSILSVLIDIAALYAAWAIQFAASGSYAAAFVTTAGLGAYGAWVWFDGFTRGRRA